jgi:N-acetylglucosamine-6-sulfatase
LPTVLDLIGQPVPGGLDGFSLLPLLQGQSSALDDRPIYAEMHAETDPASPGYWIAPRYELRSVKENGWKYILEFNNTPADALYQVEPESLYESNNLIADYPELAQQFYDQLYDWFRLPTEYFFLPTIQDQ